VIFRARMEYRSADRFANVENWRSRLQGIDLPGLEARFTD